MVLLTSKNVMSDSFSLDRWNIEQAMNENTFSQPHSCLKDWKLRLTIMKSSRRFSAWPLTPPSDLIILRPKKASFLFLNSCRPPARRQRRSHLSRLHRRLVLHRLRHQLLQRGQSPRQHHSPPTATAASIRFHFIRASNPRSAEHRKSASPIRGRGVGDLHGVLGGLAHNGGLGQEQQQQGQQQEQQQQLVAKEDCQKGTSSLVLSWYVSLARGTKRNKLGNIWVFVQLICTKTQTLPNLFLLHTWSLGGNWLKLSRLEK